MTTYVKWGLFRSKFTAGTSRERFLPTVNIATTVLSGNTYANSDGVTNTLNDADTITFNITSNLANTTVNYEIHSVSGTIKTTDFTDATLTDSITFDTDGNATITKTITNTFEGHKTFNMKLVDPSNNARILATSSDSRIYEIVPIDASGGDEEYNTSIVASGFGSYSANKYISSSKHHIFTTVGNANLTISDVGNYVGNANIWINQFVEQTDSIPNTLKNSSYWNANVGTALDSNSLLAVKAAVVGGGGAKVSGGGGAGEVGVLSYPIANISTGAFKMTVGLGGNASTTDVRTRDIPNYPNLNPTNWTILDASESTIFNEDASLSLTAAGGGIGGQFTTPKAGAYGGSGGGNGPGLSTLVLPAARGQYWGPSNDATSAGFSDLCDWSSYPTSGDNSEGPLAPFVKQIWANHGEGDSTGGPFGGGGARHSGGDDGGDPENGGGAINFPKNIGTPLNYTTGIDEDEYVLFYDSPWYKPSDTVTTSLLIGSGGNGAGTQAETSVYGGGGNTTDGNGQSGAIAIAYPYRDAYRFISLTDLT